jgi:hypothetical protein
MTISWIIEQLWVKPVSDDLTDVVVTAAWRCNGTDGTYSGTVYGTCSFNPPDPSRFVPYADLTLAEVLNWCYANGVDQSAIEANVATQIQNQINPPIITPPLPWLPPVDNSVISAPPLRDEQIVDPFKLPTSDVPPSVDGMSTTILG